MDKRTKQFLWVAVGLVAFLSLYLTVVFSFWLGFKNRVYPGVSVAGISLSGKTKQEAVKILQEKSKTQKAITFDGEKIDGLEINYDETKTYQNAVNIGKKNPFILGFRQDIPFDFIYNQENFYKLLKEKEQIIQSPVENSRIVSKENLEVKEGKQGRRLNYAQTADNFYQNVSHLNYDFKSSGYSVSPTFGKNDLSEKESELNNLIPEEITLTAEDKEFKVNKKEITSWTTLSGERLFYSKYFYGEEYLEPIFGVQNDSLFSSQLVGDYLHSISNKINKNPVNAVLSASGGNVVIQKAEVNGKELEISESTNLIVKALEEKDNTVELTIKTTKPEIRSDNLAELGLVGLVSTGYSNFSGSPANRIHNIKTGASKFNGVLIKPNETFSFNTNLGDVDASTGYLPELVILENKTQPQFGGGLCQVSSTAFRAALNAGLPIVARKAHAYPVRYYKPYGVDATIYLPSPDLRFKNDTGKYIFIQTRVVGKNLYFDFYGTKPARTVTFAGNESGAGAVPIVEKVNPLIYDQGARGNGSFTAVIYRFITDSAGKVTSAKWISKYDSPDKYPH